MMKKNGFTLAEVLITLAIIGVVATMTLPALMTNTAEQQAKTALKKGINTLTEAAQMNSAIDNYDYSNLLGYGNVDETTGEGTSKVTVDNFNYLLGILEARTSIDYVKTRANVDGVKTNTIATQKSGFGGTTGQTVYFRDGSALLLPAVGTIKKDGDVAYNTMLADGLVQGFQVIYDTNGAKSPNVLSNCEGNVGGAEDTDTNYTKPLETPDSKGACNNKTKRVIKDQFVVRLRGNIAVPSGAAANWAFNN